MNTIDGNQEFDFDISEYEDLLAASREIAREDGFTLIPDAMTRIYGLAIASVWSVIRRHTKMSKGYCCASHETLARFLGVSVSTLERHLKVLIRDKYIVDVTPNIKNRPHVYMTTRKFEFEIVVSISESGREERHIKKSPSQNDRVTPSNCIGHPVKLTDEDTIKDTIKDKKGAQKTCASPSSLDDLDDPQDEPKPDDLPGKRAERAHKVGLELLPRWMQPFGQAFLDGLAQAGLNSAVYIPDETTKAKWRKDINAWSAMKITDPEVIKKAACGAAKAGWDIYSPGSITSFIRKELGKNGGSQPVEVIWHAGMPI